MDQPLVLTHAFPGLPNIRCAFTTRQGGVSTGPHDSLNISLDVGDNPQNVLTNRRRLQSSLGFANWSELRQVHGTRTVFNPDPTPLTEPGQTQADGHATTTPNLALVIKTADCQPILIAHASGQYILALHSGWRGNRQNYPHLAVLEFCATYSLAPADLHAVIGPSLGPDSSEFINFDQEWGQSFNHYFNLSSKTLDLRRLSHDQLTNSGIPPAHIHSLDLCTLQRSDLFFSYRRDKSGGRQASLIWIEK